MAITTEQIAETLEVTCDTVIANEKYLSDLDGLAGDGDFGISLAAGFKVLKKELPEIDRSAFGAMLLRVSTICSEHVGGSSGPIWGTGFMKAGMASKGMTEISMAQLGKMVGAAIEGIMVRGGASRGDKTLLDALLPIHEKLQEMAAYEAPGAILAAVTAEADKAIDQTRALIARRGHAGQAGARSADTPDPGIVAIATILRDWCRHYNIDYEPHAKELRR